VDTLPERKKGSAAARYGSLIETNQAQRLVRQLPTAAQWQTGPAKNHRKRICLQPELKEKIMPKKEKSLFDKAIDALTDRDEKEAAAKAAQEKALADAAKKEAEARAKRAAENAAAEKLTADKIAAENAAAARVAAEQANAERIAAAKAAAPKKGVVTVRSLRIRADHNTTSEVVAGLVNGDEVTILSTWTDGKDTWAKLDKGWAAMVYDGEMYIKINQGP
jgi:membrane protein involved in colicin uptake